MTWFPSLKITPKIEQRESYWGLLPRFEPTAKVTKQPGTVTQLFGALSHLDRENNGPTVSELAADKGHRLELKAVAKVEKWQAKAIKASGNQFEVTDRDGHPRGCFPTPQAAQARADEVGGLVRDRIENRHIYSAFGRPDRDAIPDPGIFTPQVADWELDW